MRRSDLLWRAALVVAALAALVAGAPQAVTGGLTLVALVAAGERLVRLRDRGGLDRVLVLVGGLLVALVLTGMLLGATPIGLRPTTWVVALSVLSAAGLGLAALAPRPGGVAVTRGGTYAVLRVVPWLAVAVAVVAFSVQVSAHSLKTVDASPLQMSFGKVSGTTVPVVVSSSSKVGPLEIRASAGGNDLSYPLFTVGTDGSVTTMVSLPKKGRFVITLNYPDQTQPLRTLVLDR